MEDSQTKGSEQPIGQETQKPGNGLDNDVSEKPSAVVAQVSVSEQPASAEGSSSAAATASPATESPSDNRTAEPTPSAAIPKWPGDLSEIKPEVRRVSYHHFKNLRGDNESRAAVYALYGEASLKADIKKEQQFRKRSQDPTKTSNTEDVEADTVGRSAAKNNVLHRIRINSAFILRHLHSMSDTAYSWEHPKHYVFFRPFRPLIELQEKMKIELEHLRKKWGSSDNTNTEPTGDRPSLNANSPELLDNREALRHMEVYVNFIDNDVMPLCEMFKDPSRTRVAFHDLWYLFHAGQYVYRPQPMNKKKSPASGPSTSNSSIMATYQTLLRAYSIVIPEVASDPDEEIINPDTQDYDVGYDDSWSSGTNCVRIHSYYIDFDGESYVPSCFYEKITKYDDEKEITDLIVYPLDYHPDKSNIMKSQIASGERFKQLIEQKHVYHFGWTVSHEPDGWPIKEKDDYRNHIDSEFIIDYSEAFKSTPEWEPSSYNPCDRIKDQAGVSRRTFLWRTYPTSEVKLKTRVWSTQTNQFDDVSPDENCVLVDADNIGVIHQSDFFKSDNFFQSLAKGEEPALGTGELCLLPKKLVGFALRERNFFNVEIRSLRPLKSQKDVWQMLKIDANNRRMVQSLVKEHFRKKDALKEAQNSRKLEEVEMANQDAVRGKGSGLGMLQKVFLLHGVPGVGKTATAEAVAQENKRPLFSITCGDLGIEATEVEKNLSRIFRLANLWDCVLLLDEADIFFTRRTPTDLQRNALVTVFLRVLEYYSGVLFLTTNRVGTIDEAFKSRIHVSLYYKDLDWEQIRQIFQYNIDRVRELEELEKEETRLVIEESSIMMWAENQFKHSTKLGRWNGRQIRNAFQTAVSLAHYDVQDDDLTKFDKNTGRRMLNYMHFAEVLETTQQFDEYMAKVVSATDGELAQRQRIRLDDYERPATTKAWNHGLQYGQIPQSPTPAPLGLEPQRHPSEISAGHYRTPHRQMPHQALDGRRGGSPMMMYDQQSPGARPSPMQPILTNSDPPTSMGYQSHEVYSYREGERGLDGTAQASRQTTMNFSPSDMRSDMPMAGRQLDPHQGQGAQPHNFMVEHRVVM